MRIDKYRNICAHCAKRTFFSGLQQEITDCNTITSGNACYGDAEYPRKHGPAKAAFAKRIRAVCNIPEIAPNNCTFALDWAPRQTGRKPSLTSGRASRLTRAGYTSRETAATIGGAPRKAAAMRNAALNRRSPCPQGGTPTLRAPTRTRLAALPIAPWIAWLATESGGGVARPYC